MTNGDQIFRDYRIVLTLQFDSASILFSFNCFPFLLFTFFFFFASLLNTGNKQWFFKTKIEARRLYQVSERPLKEGFG